MTALNLTATDSRQKTVLEHLIPLISDTLAEKINNGVTIEKDGKRLISKKDLSTFMTYAAGKNGGVCNFALKTPAVLTKEIMAGVSKEGCGISRDAAAFLAEQCSCNTLMIENEIEKLTAYASGNEITVDMIKALSPRQIETTTFDLARAITRMDAKAAMRLFGDLAQEKTESIIILYSITGNMLDLYRARAAMSCRKTAADVKEDFGRSEERRVGKECM